MVASRVNHDKTLRKIKSRSSRAELVFPVGRIHRHIKCFQRIKHLRCGVGAGVYVAAVLEYLTAEVLELAGNASRMMKKRRLQPCHIYRAITCDQELHDFLRHIIIPGGGVVPQIHKALLPKLKKVKKENKQARKPQYQKQPTRSKRSTKKTPIAKISTKPKLLKKTSEDTKSSAPPRVVSVHAGDIVVLSEKMLHLGQKLTVVKSDIVKIAADAVVHPTNASLYCGGHVGQVLVRHGGAEFANELALLKNSGNISLYGCVISKAFGINAKFIIHCNGPTQSDANGLSNLDKTVHNIFKLAEQRNLTSIALPSIGSGRAGFPKQPAAETILRAIHGYFNACVESSIKQIYFVLFDKASIDVYIAELARLDE